VQEIWKDVPGFEGLYQANAEGRVRSIRSQKLLRPFHDERGYGRCGFYDAAGKFKCVMLHKAVYTAFNGPLPEGLEVDHIDDSPWNNRLDNLRAVTRQENVGKSWARRRAAGIATTEFRPKMVCLKGHERTRENTIITAGGRHKCRICAEEKEKRPRAAGFIPATELATRTHCDAGHALTPGNLARNKSGQARCRQCHNAYMNEYRRSKKQEQSA
jgi:hypothetical protein